MVVEGAAWGRDSGRGRGCPTILCVVDVSCQGGVTKGGESRGLFARELVVVASVVDLRFMRGEAQTGHGHAKRPDLGTSHAPDLPSPGRGLCRLKCSRKDEGKSGSQGFLNSGLSVWCNREWGVG